MKRVLMCSVLAACVAWVGCGKDENNASNNSTTGTNSSNNNTTGTNSGTNNEIPVAGDCEWGEFLATCGGGRERDLSVRAVGCREYYEPSPTESVQQATLCEDDIWDEMETCSDSGLSGRRPVGCCFELDAENELYSRHCYYDDPANLESSAETAEEACASAGFCWIPPEMM